MGFIEEVILTRSSNRSFAGAPISESTLERITRAAFAAPSAVNVQPWDLIIVTKRETFDSLGAALPYAKMLDKAGSAFVVCGNPSKDDSFAPRYWVQDCSAMAENILLAAHALDLGAVWTAVYPESDRIEVVRQILGIPRDRIPLCVIPIGVIVGTAAEPKDKFNPSAIHRDHW